MLSKEVQSVLLLVKLQIAALQRKANKTGPPTTNLHAQRLAKGLGEIEEALEIPDEPTVARIMWSWLKSHGYTALCGDECGCGIDDLFPCGGDFASLNCKPGYWRKATDEQCRDMDMPLGSFGAFLDKEPDP